MLGVNLYEDNSGWLLLIYEKPLLTTFFWSSMFNQIRKSLSLIFPKSVFIVDECTLELKFIIILNFTTSYPSRLLPAGAGNEWCGVLGSAGVHDYPHDDGVACCGSGPVLPGVVDMDQDVFLPWGCSLCCVRLPHRLQRLLLHHTQLTGQACVGFFITQLS